MGDRVGLDLYTDMELSNHHSAHTAPLPVSHN